MSAVTHSGGKTMNSRYTTLATATKPTIAAVRASPLSSPLTVGALETTGAGRGGVVGAAGRDATGAALARGAGAAEVGAPAGAAAGAAVAPVGPPGGSVGNLIVGAADGFGGKLMRTVSFFG